MASSDEGEMVETYKGKEIIVSDTISIFVVEGSENIEAYRGFTVVNAEELTIEEKFKRYTGNEINREEFFDWNQEEKLWMIKGDIDLSVYKNFNQDSNYITNLAIAYDYFTKNDFTNAIEILKQLYQQGFRNDIVLYWHAKCYFNLNEYVHAQNCLSKIEEKNIKCKILLIKCFHHNNKSQSFEMLEEVHDYFAQYDKDHVEHAYVLRLLCELCKEKQRKEWIGFAIKLHDLDGEYAITQEIADHFFKEENYNLAKDWYIYCWEQNEFPEIALKITKCCAKLDLLDEACEWITEA